MQKMETNKHEIGIAKSEIELLAVSGWQTAKLCEVQAVGMVGVKPPTSELAEKAKDVASEFTLVRKGSELIAPTERDYAGAYKDWQGRLAPFEAIMQKRRLTPEEVEQFKAVYFSKPRKQWVHRWTETRAVEWATLQNNKDRVPTKFVLVPKLCMELDGPEKVREEQVWDHLGKKP